MNGYKEFDQLEGKFGHRNDIVAEGVKIDNVVEHGSCMYHISLWEIMKKINFYYFKSSLYFWRILVNQSLFESLQMTREIQFNHYCGYPTYYAVYICQTILNLLRE